MPSWVPERYQKVVVEFSKYTFVGALATIAKGHARNMNQPYVIGESPACPHGAYIDLLMAFAHPNMKIEFTIPENLTENLRCRHVSMP